MFHLTAKELPDSERPYEKCIRYGTEMMSDAELLAVILRSGNAEMNSVQLAQKILSAKSGNLMNLYDLSVSDLMGYKGIGSVKAIQMKCVAELAKRISMTKHQKQVVLSDARSVAWYYMESLRHEKKERIVISLFDSKSQLLGDELISIGSVSASLSSPREIFLKALEHEAVYFILLHNHPSGNPSPSKEDLLMTSRIKDGGELLGIHLADHIIIGDNSYYSFREYGQL